MQHEPLSVDGAVAEPDATTPTARTSDGEDGPGSELDEACLDVAQLSAKRATQLRMLAKLGIVSQWQSGCTP